MSASTDAVDVTIELLREWRLPEPRGSKYERGHVVVIGGARRTPGAAMLAGVSALRVGAGRLTIAVGKSVASGVGIAVPESGVIALAESTEGDIDGNALHDLTADLERANAVLVGPGLGDADRALVLLEGLAELIPRRTPVVLDAFALGVLNRSTIARMAFAGRMLLTPNREELAILLDRDAEDLGEDASRAARQFNAVVSCFGIIADSQGRRWRVPGVSSGLGTSGSGDVLAGAVAGLLARGATAAQAAVWGTWLHANAGARLDVQVGAVGYLAHELTEVLPAVLDDATRDDG